MKQNGPFQDKLERILEYKRSLKELNTGSQREDSSDSVEQDSKKKYLKPHFWGRANSYDLYKKGYELIKPLNSDERHQLRELALRGGFRVNR